MSEKGLRRARGAMLFFGGMATTLIIQAIQNSIGLTVAVAFLLAVVAGLGTFHWAAREDDR